MMSKCLLLKKNYREGVRYADSAKAVYPAEAQAFHLSGFGRLQLQQFESAYEDFSAYGQRLPKDPSASFFKGYALEGMKKKQQAAREYQRYLQAVQEGAYAQHAKRRLVEWGYAR